MTSAKLVTCSPDNGNGPSRHRNNDCIFFYFNLYHSFLDVFVIAFDFLLRFCLLLLCVVLFVSVFWGVFLFCFFFWWGSGGGGRDCC